MFEFRVAKFEFRVAKFEFRVAKFELPNTKLLRYEYAFVASLTLIKLEWRRRPNNEAGGPLKLRCKNFGYIDRAYVTGSGRAGYIMWRTWSDVAEKRDVWRCDRKRPQENVHTKG